MGAELHTTGQNRYMGTGKTGVGATTYSFTPTARTTAATLATVAGATGKYDLGFKIGERFRGVDITFNAKTASTSCNYRIYAVRRGVNQATEDYELSLLCSGSFTSSAAGVGVSDTAVVHTDEYVADIITVTTATGAAAPTGEGAAIVAAYGSPGPQAYSPGTGAVAINMTAHLIIPDVGSAESIVIDLAAAAAVMNATVEAIV